MMAARLRSGASSVDGVISEVTIQIHRSKIMKKMGAGSLAELVRMAGMLEIPITHSRRAQ
jgi:FixJ family two-component response regulator